MTHLNKYKLERIVVKTYKFVQKTIADSSKHRAATINTILSLCDTLGMEYEKDYFVENIMKELNDIENNPSKLYDPYYEPPNIFLT